MTAHKPFPLHRSETLYLTEGGIETEIMYKWGFSLPHFAMFPLLHLTGSRKRMGSWRSGRFLMIAGWSSALLITAMDIYGLPDSLAEAWQIITGG